MSRRSSKDKPMNPANLLAKDKWNTGRKYRIKKKTKKVWVEIVATYFVSTGKPIQRKDIKVARVERHYDSHGNQIEGEYCKADEKPMICIDLGTTRIFWRYNDKGQQIKGVLNDPDGAPIYDQSERTNLK